MQSDESKIGTNVNTSAPKNVSNAPRTSKKQPSLRYVCRACNVPGHWIHDCPKSSVNVTVTEPVQITTTQVPSNFLRSYAQAVYDSVPFLTWTMHVNSTVTSDVLNTNRDLIFLPLEVNSVPVQALHD